jgi:plastocyanin
MREGRGNDLTVHLYQPSKLSLEWTIVMCGKLRSKIVRGFFFLVGFSLCASVGNAYEVVTVIDGGSITGRVKFAGMVAPPQKVEISKDQAVCGKTEKFDESVLIGEDHGLQNVLVSILDIQKGKGFADSAPILDQRDCRYIPHLVLVPAGTPLTILNNDGVLHSVHTQSVKNSAFNRAQSKFKKEMQETFVHPEIIKLTCDVHSWMSGWIIVQEHPYVAVSGEDGSFELLGVPPGQYVVSFWHEVLGVKETVLVVEAGKQIAIQFEMGN